MVIGQSHFCHKCGYSTFSQDKFKDHEKLLNMAEAGLTILIHWVKSRNTNVDNKCNYSTDYPVHVQSVQQRKTEISTSMIFKLNCDQGKMQLDSVVSLIQES